MLHFLNNFQTENGAHTLSYLVIIGGFSPGAMWLCCEVNHLLYFSAEEKRAWNYTSRSPMLLYDVHRSNLTLCATFVRPSKLTPLHLALALSRAIRN
jgi:hypothetical protein